MTERKVTVRADDLEDLLSRVPQIALVEQPSPTVLRRLWRSLGPDAFAQAAERIPELLGPE